ncbi:peroxisomal carnitine O-octanoyltransferase-like [Ciona intestinalis]
MASVFLVEDPSKAENKTFYNDENLPSLPVPTVQQTIKKYLDSCKAVLTEEEFGKTAAICDKFFKEDGPKLQEKLLERSKVRKNWLDEWWLKKVYLEGRAPLATGNFSGPGTYIEHYWPLKPGTQLERIALGTYHFMQFWQLIRRELIASHSLGDEKKLTMHQFRYLFNTCRIPHRGMDQLSHSFKTEAEGTAPTHIVVISRGYFFSIPSVNSTTGEIYTPPEYYAMFKEIQEISIQRKKKGVPVAALTALDRDTWADARDHLIAISPKNKEVLEEIETSLIITTLDDTSPADYTELSFEAMCGDPGQRWYDKSYNSATTENGGNLCLCDHTPYDAMVMVALVEFMTQAIKQAKGVWDGPWHTDVYEKPKELIFTLDETSMMYINKATTLCRETKDNIELLQIVFEKFGKAAFKQYKIHPDFVVQLCLQLAYMKTHGKPGPTYETAMTRQFYHGRTETCRSCTPESVDFCKAILQNPNPGSKAFKQLKPLLQAAHKKFVTLMADCLQNKGCDRHLLGLLFICLENGFPIPELYTDPAFAASGGNGNFVLSTSCVGYFHAQGSVAPMVDNGYGFFYRINDNKIIYSVSAFNSNKETNAGLLSINFQNALISVLHILSQSNAKL